jgi:hypothetical protein
MRDHPPKDRRAPIEATMMVSDTRTTGELIFTLGDGGHVSVAHLSPQLPAFLHLLTVINCQPILRRRQGREPRS